MKTLFFSRIAKVLMFSSFAFGASAFAQTVSIGTDAASFPSFSFIGSGCAPESGADAHWEGSTLVLNFGSMVAEKGQGISLLESRKNCAITLDLKVPAGLSYALGAYSASGYDELADKDTRNFTLSTFFQGQTQTGSSKDDKVGELSSDFNIRHFNQGEELVWSPCGLQRAQTINAALRVGSGGDRQANSVSRIDSIRLSFRVKQCSPVLR